MDAFDEHVRDMQQEPGWWGGHFKGGPLDGAPFNIGAAGALEMRGMLLNVCVGEENRWEWHAHTFGQVLSPETGGIESRFTHLGVIDGEPKLPEDPAPRQ